MSTKHFPFWIVSAHTFILGAGASRAAFPNGDKNGRRLPLMKDLIATLELERLFECEGIDYSNKNIEDIYNSLYERNPKSPLLEDLNNLITKYFSSLKIPDEVTLYDELILSLQKKDSIFSFNWDPLLVQAYSRNCDLKELPSIYFLHGNVAIGVCIDDMHTGSLGEPMCCLWQEIRSIPTTVPGFP